MSEVSAEYLRQALAQQTSDTVLAYLLIEHPSLAAPIRIVNHLKAVTRSDGVYQPFPFQVPEPEQAEGQIPQVKVIIDNVDTQINDALEGLSDYPTITFFATLLSTPDTVESGPYMFSLKNIQGDEHSLSGTLGFEDDVFAQQAPGQNYLPSNSPGMFL